MKAINVIHFTCLFAAAGLAVCLAFERRAVDQLDLQNKILRRQLSGMDAAVAENRRLSGLALETNHSPTRSTGQVAMPSAPEDRSRELLRLRTEVTALRQRSNEIETLRADTRQARAARDSALNATTADRAANNYNATAPDGSQFEIVRADYWTARTNVDVAPELRDRVRSGGLKAIASNNLKGDPDFGQVKNLTIVYRFRGVTMTNEFREGDYIVLPPE